MSEAFRFTGEIEQQEAEVDLLWSLGCQGLWQDGEEIVAYFSERINLPLEGIWQTEDQDYLHAYYAQLKPIYLSSLVVAPTHSPVELQAGQKAVWLDPGMAFGSGHHETTYMALRALESIELRGKTVLDVGAGSGILAIAADLLGAKRCLGLDIDQDTVPIAKENARLNCSKAEFALGIVQDEEANSADVVVANLYAELHETLARHYQTVLCPGGQLILTGILREKVPGVLRALKAFEVEAPVYKGEWALVAARLLPMGKEIHAS